MPGQPSGKAWILLNDAEWYVAREELRESVTGLLGQTAQRLSPLITQCSWFPKEVLQKSPKISRGENYRGKPWMILDYPAFFEKDGVFAFRFMVLYGDALHCTFHISGKYLEAWRDTISANLLLNSESGLYICHEGDPWIHHIDPEAFSVKDREAALLVQNAEFLKFGKAFGFERWNEIPDLCKWFFGRTSLLLKR